MELSNGSTPVIDFRVWYAFETGTSSVLATGITTRSYTTTITLQSGSNYKFKV